ncbi:50S ribosomal protein L29 [Candidatus Woesearchaeota archaeon]|jgi:large subunit ribosomal protein L29|nr:50S ribosomal protein L29 [Candidatus Woesearchaeota archaeon]|tara:strand:- start:300 stop:509 length:210 start_codon:yes stop_codon:yes gene_type:complete
MAILRASEIRDKKPKDLEKSLNELKSELMKLNSQKTSGRMPENPGKIKALKRTIARIHTIKKESEVAKK